MLPQLAFTALFAPQSLKSDLEELLSSSKLKGAVVGASVERADGTLIFEKNPDTRLVPASNQKLLTVAYALAQLGKDYRPTTKIWKLKDRLVVDSTGDPMLTFAQLQAAKKKLAAGKLPVYVRQAYKPGVPPSWELDDLPNKYAAPVTSFTVDRGSFELWADMGKAYFLPTSFGSKIQYVASKRFKTRFDPFHKTAYIYGPLSIGKRRLDTLALYKPDEAAASLLGSGMRHAASVPNTTPTLTITGSTLAEIAKECLRKSDNNIAEHLLLMGAAKDGDLGENPYEKASERIQAFFEKNLGLEEGSIHVVDGSGMSRHNYVTARALTELMHWAEGQPWADVWMPSLAAPGVTGTLQNRLKGSSFQGKTGTLDAMVSLTGYLRTKEGGGIVLSLIINNHAGKNPEIRSIADDFVRKIEESSLTGTVLDTYETRESPSPLTSAGPVSLHWLHRSRDNGGPPRQWAHRGDESRHEGAHRAERMAFRLR